jgi:hypothetical protein
MRAAHVIAVLSLVGCARPASAPCAAAPEPPAESSTAAPAPEVAAPLKAAKPELAVLERLVGTWRGTGQGEPGDATVERTYGYVLGGRFLEVRNRSTYAAQPKNPKGERHEDQGLYSYDGGRKKLVFRQFHVEGFVNQYVIETHEPDRLVFVTESIENIPPGFRGRETLRFVGPDALEETFEIAPPKQDFAVYSTTKLQRVAP